MLFKAPSIEQLLNYDLDRVVPSRYMLIFFLLDVSIIKIFSMYIHCVLLNAVLLNVN